MSRTQFTIYCHTNRVNGKRYVGQTVFTMEKRWADHVSLAKSGKRSSQALTSAIRKYGVDAFDHQVLEVVSTQEEANLTETRWIEQLTCRVPNGYNLQSGGGVCEHHEDSKRLIAKSLRARWKGMTPEERESAVRPLAESLRAWWQNMTPEEYDLARGRRAERLRAQWDKLTPEERSARQVARQSAVAPDRRSATIAKSWETRRAKYGQDGVKRARSHEEHSESIKKGWGSMSPEARAERVRKIKEGVRKARAVRTSRMVRINLLQPQLGAP